MSKCRGFSVFYGGMRRLKVINYKIKVKRRFLRLSRVVGLGFDFRRKEENR